MNVSGIDAAGFHTNTNHTVQMTTTGTDETATIAHRADTVELSPGGLLMSNIMTPDVERETGVISLSDIGAQIAIDKRKIDKELQTYMDRFGIDHNTEFRLTTTVTGRIRIEGDFKGKKQLEEAINTDREFRNTFARMSANSSLVEAAKRGEEFRRAYEIDPESAVERFAYLLNDSTSYRFTYDYKNGQSVIGVEVV